MGGGHRGHLLLANMLQPPLSRTPPARRAPLNSLLHLEGVIDGVVTPIMAAITAH
uniref:Uncharacterized protein n=1 Tax=Arundo donax TaxID=35708 RepID=A0A0A8YIB3_ARUDO